MKEADFLRADLNHQMISPEIEVSPRFHLRGECKLASGVKRAAIYDLEQGNVYSLNETAREIVSGLPDQFGFWEELAKIGLAEASPAVPFKEEKAEIPQVGLEFMWLELTGKCNERCLHCYASAGVSQAEELPLERWRQVIEEGAALGCRQLQFIGGEPFSFEGIFELAKAARDSHYEFIEIFTNGSLLNEEKVRKIKDLGIHVAVSLYSIVPEVHDTITRTPGSFQKTFKALEMLKEAEVPTRVGIIIMKQNQATAIETQKKLEEMGFGYTKMDVLRPTGRGGCADLLPDDKAVQTWALVTRPNFSTSREEFYRNQHWNSCWAGKIAITPNGEIIPCVFARKHIVSNINQSLEEAVNSEELQSLWRITKDKIEGCNGCEYRYACHDCRPLAEDTTGNLYAKNSRCTYDPLVGIWNQMKGGEKE